MTTSECDCRYRHLLNSVMLLQGECHDFSSSARRRNQIKSAIVFESVWNRRARRSSFVVVDVIYVSHSIWKQVAQRDWGRERERERWIEKEDDEEETKRREETDSLSRHCYHPLSSFTRSTWKKTMRSDCAEEREIIIRRIFDEPRTNVDIS